MAEKTNTKKENAVKTSQAHASVDANACNDRLCPKHGTEKVKTRGRVFEGVVIRKFHGRVTIQFERMLYIPKYERYEKRKTKLHARLTRCMENDVNMGDLIEIAETRPISKMIHFIVTNIVKKNESKIASEDEGMKITKKTKGRSVSGGKTQ